MDGVTASSLPVVPVLPRIVELLGAHRSLVLVAPPGAGKTTLVPLALLEAPWMAGQGMVMLEPRRLAARAAAMRMAELLGEPVGERVGYRMRGESRVSSATRITVMTEGVLTRTLHEDPELPGIGLLLFDEFHERTIQADLGMAFALDVQGSLRDDLRILVMSATLEGEQLSTFLHQAPLICSEGRLYPVETVRIGRGRGERIEDAVMRGVERALTETAGDLLVFLPGASEIRRVAERLAERSHCAGGRISVHPLFSALTREEQNAAIRPGRDGQRKIVLATNIAESSLTIEGVTAVIDSGLERRPRYNPATGMSGLETVRIARTSAVQRCGRAGRLAPGRCYQLWEMQDEFLMPVSSRPEIDEADLTSLVLEVAGWGVRAPEELRWLDSPAGPRWDQAVFLLRRLDALLDDGRISSVGRKMLALPLHPRLSHMVTEALNLGLEALAWETAVLLEERDCLSSAGNPDLRLRFEALHAGEKGWPSSPGLSADRGALAQIRSALAALPGRGRLLPAAVEQVGLLLSLAYPERIAMRRGPGRAEFQLASGRGGRLTDPLAFAGEDFIVAGRIDDEGVNGRIDLAAPLSLEEILTHHRKSLVTRREVVWDKALKDVIAREQLLLDQLPLRESLLSAPQEEELLAAVTAGLRLEGLSLLGWDEEARSLQGRAAFLRLEAVNVAQTIPDLSGEALLARLESDLSYTLSGCRNAADLRRVKVKELLAGVLGYAGMSLLEREAPSRVQVPSGSMIAIDYSGPVPVLAVRIQEIFGLPESPKIAGGRVSLLLHLLSPAGRPVQITRDLASFWRTGYSEVRKDLRARYSKHFWPEDPATAPATRHTKKRMERDQG